MFTIYDLGGWHDNTTKIVKPLSTECRAITKNMFSVLVSFASTIEVGLRDTNFFPIVPQTTVVHKLIESLSLLNLKKGAYSSFLY